jgi:hypothetical protein
MREDRRVSLLTAIARSRNRIETTSTTQDRLGALAKHEKLAERHVRLLAEPYGFEVPKIKYGC